MPVAPFAFRTRFANPGTFLRCFLVKPLQPVHPYYGIALAPVAGCATTSSNEMSAGNSTIGGCVGWGGRGGQPEVSRVRRVVGVRVRLPRDDREVESHISPNHPALELGVSGCTRYMLRRISQYVDATRVFHEYCTACCFRISKRSSVLARS